MSANAPSHGPRIARTGTDRLGEGRLLRRRTRVPLRGLIRPARERRQQILRAVGGPARARVILAFGAVLALNGADNSTIGAVAPQLEHALHIGNTKVGLLSSVSLLVGALFVIPVGFFVDRSRRVPLLAGSIVLWGIASLLSAFAVTYNELLLTRLAMGAVTATTGPAIASLMGDYFSVNERGRIYAYVLVGEVAGTAVGFILCGTLASAISWRAAFPTLAFLGFLLAWLLCRSVPEPPRGGRSQLGGGVAGLGHALATDSFLANDRAPHNNGSEPDPADSLTQATIKAQGIEADPRLVLREDPRQMGLARAIRYTLRIPTNVVLIISSALGYFYFSGLQTFALLFIRGHYHANEATAELVLALLVGGGLAGTLISGKITDFLVRRGLLSARIYVASVCYLAAAVLLVPGILVSSLGIALLFDVGGAGLLLAANPALDAARLDIMPAGLWGRAESARTCLRSLAQAGAPLAFGGVADVVSGVTPAQAPVGTHTGIVSATTAHGLEISFLIMLLSLVLAGASLLRARATYPRDVATATASHDAQPKK